MRRLLLAFGSGALFAVGLAVGGMTTPSKVTGFLDFTSGHWDPSLAFVMAGAVGVFLPLQWLARRRSRPLLATRFAIPVEKPIDGRLVAGAAVFGLGWGAVGYCPGPAIVSISTGSVAPLSFVGGMVLGMVLFELARARRPRAAEPRPPRLDASARARP